MAVNAAQTIIFLSTTFVIVAYGMHADVQMRRQLMARHVHYNVLNSASSVHPDVAADLSDEVLTKSEDNPSTSLRINSAISRDVLEGYEIIDPVLRSYQNSVHAAIKNSVHFCLDTLRAFSLEKLQKSFPKALEPVTLYPTKYQARYGLLYWLCHLQSRTPLVNRELDKHAKFITKNAEDLVEFDYFISLFDDTIAHEFPNLARLLQESKKIEPVSAYELVALSKHPYELMALSGDRVGILSATKKLQGIVSLDINWFIASHQKQKILKVSDNCIAEAFPNGILEFWHLPTTHCFLTLDGFQDIACAVILSDQCWVAGFGDGGIIVYDWQQPDTDIVCLHGGPIKNLLRVSENEFISFGSDGRACVWRIVPRSVERVNEFQCTVGPHITAIAVLPNKRIALGLSNGVVITCSIFSSENDTAVLSQNDGPVKILVALSDGRLAVCTTYGFIRIWDLATFETILFHASCCGPSGVHSLIQAKTGELVSCSGNGIVHKWFIKKWSSIRKIFEYIKAKYVCL